MHRTIARNDRRRGTKPQKVIVWRKHHHMAAKSATNKKSKLLALNLNWETMVEIPSSTNTSPASSRGEVEASGNSSGPYSFENRGPPDRTLETLLWHLSLNGDYDALGAEAEERAELAAAAHYVAYLETVDNADSEEEVEIVGHGPTKKKKKEKVLGFDPATNTREAVAGDREPNDFHSPPARRSIQAGSSTQSDWTTTSHRERESSRGRDGEIQGEQEQHQSPSRGVDRGSDLSYGLRSPQGLTLYTNDLERSVDLQTKANYTLEEIFETNEEAVLWHQRETKTRYRGDATTQQRMTSPAEKEISYGANMQGSIRKSLDTQLEKQDDTRRTKDTKRIIYGLIQGSTKTLAMDPTTLEALQDRGWNLTNTFSSMTQAENWLARRSGAMTIEVRRCQRCRTDISEHPPTHALCLDCFCFRRESEACRFQRRRCECCGKDISNRPSHHFLCYGCWIGY